MNYIAQYRQESRCYNETLKGRLTLEGLRAYWRNFQILSKLPHLTGDTIYASQCEHSQD